MASACDDKAASTGSAEGSAKAADTPAASAAAKDEPAAKAPACDAVVDKIASFNPGSGDAERKLWNKMCDEMAPKERTCAVGVKDMAGLKGCMGSKGDEKLEK